MDGDGDVAPSPDRARGSSWGGREVRAELRRISDDVADRAGFRVCAIEVLRGDGLLELVAFTGGGQGDASMGGSFSLNHVRQVLRHGTRYGAFVFLAEEAMDADLQEAIRGYGYVPSVAHATDPEGWRPLDMLVAALTDASGRIRALLHLDEPLSGHRPRPEELRDIAARLELSLQAVMATVDRDELTRRARLDQTTRALVRAVSERPAADELLARVDTELVAGFRARSVSMRLYDEPGEPPVADGAAAIPACMRSAIEAATRRAWQSRTVIIAEPGRVWGDDRLEREHLQDLTDHLAAHAAGEMLFVPIGAGHESMGVLVVVRDAQAGRWTEGESQAALGVGHDLGRALLTTRAHEREQHLIDQLRRLDEYRQQLITTVSHELRNPLGAVALHLEMLNSVDGMPTAATTSLDALGRGTARLISLVDDLLLLSRINNLDSPTAKLTVDLRAVLVEVVEEESLRATQQRVTLDVAPCDDICLAGEPEELRQLIANVVGNAVKYSHGGGTVRLSLEEREDEVVFTCADTGLGISEGDLEHVFTEFYRSTDLEALRRPGTGLGLAIVSRIVARHVGRMEVESELGKGTTFRVYLPRVRP